jgi:hypothetical protein
VTARARRCVVEKVQAAEGISERRAVRWTGFSRSTIRYQSSRPPQDELRARIRELAGERPRWGYRRIHVLLRREGWVVNRKRVQRLYREGGLAVRRKGKRRRSQAPALVRGPLAQPDQRWSLDFVSDTLSSGRTFTHADSPFKAMAEKYGVSEAQILLRWAIQKGFGVLPKSTNNERVRENLDLFSFAIDASDMAAIEGMDRGGGVAWAAGDPMSTT